MSSVIVVATFFPVPERREDLISVLEKTIPTVHADDAGCQLYALHEGKDRLVMIEKWEDMDALKAHGQSPALTALGASLDGLLLSPPDVQRMSAHPAGTAPQGAL